MSGGRDSEPISFEGVEVLHATGLALYFELEGEKVWIPRSQILDGSNFGDDSEEGDEGELIIPEWLAIEKELV